MSNKKVWFIIVGIKSLFFIACTGLLFIKRANAQRWFDVTAPIDQDMVISIQVAPQNDINKYNESGYTGLMIAAAKGYVEIAKAFLDRNANPYLQQQFNFFGYTALHLAINYSNNENSFVVAKMLLDYGVPIYIRDQIGETPFHSILQMSSLDLDRRMVVADYLIDQGAQINAQDNFGNTMLHDAVQNQDKQWIRVFRMKYGNLINMNIRNNLGFTVIEYATYLGFDDEEDSPGEALRMPVNVIAGPQAYQTADETGKTGLMYAIYRGDIDLAQSYIAQGANVNARDNKGNSALHIAMISLRPVDAVKLLLASNADINSINQDGQTPMLMLMKVEQPRARKEIAQLLISKKANIAAIDNKGLTIIDLAKRQQDDSLYQLLIAAS